MKQIRIEKLVILKFAFMIGDRMAQCITAQS